MKTVVGIGGTGQLVIHYYMQLYLLGVVREPFEAVIIDTDQLADPLKKAQAFLANLDGGQEPVARIRYVHVEPGENAAAKVAELVAANSAPAHDHPCRAFLSSELLALAAHEGLFARPAVSSLVFDPNKIALNFLTAAERVVVVGSMIGGTGGGLIAPVISRTQKLLTNAGAGNCQIRAVLFGSWFQPNIAKIRQEQMMSNERLVSTAIKEVLGAHLSSFAFISNGGRGSYPVLGDKPDWPASAEPLWQGVYALHFMLRDTTVPQRMSFFENEQPMGSIVKDGLVTPITRSVAEARRAKVLPLVEAFLDQDVISRLFNDFLRNRVWGMGLASLAFRYSDIAGACAGSRTLDFVSLIKSELYALWRTEGLGGIFPQPDATPVAPGAIAATAWSQPPVNNPIIFNSPATTARRCASAIIFDVLRGGN